MEIYTINDLLNPSDFHFDPVNSSVAKRPLVREFIIHMQILCLQALLSIEPALKVGYHDNW